MLCNQILPKKVPMLRIKFLPKKAHYVKRNIFLKKIPMLRIQFLPKRPPCYALNFHIQGPPC